VEWVMGDKQERKGEEHRVGEMGGEIVCDKCRMNG